MGCLGFLTKDVAVVSIRGYGEFKDMVDNLTRVEIRELSELYMDPGWDETKKKFLERYVNEYRDITPAINER